jgi:hypothetical protein
MTETEHEREQVAAFSITADGMTVIEWPDGRPDEVMVKTDALEAWVKDRNDLVRQVQDRDEALRTSVESMSMASDRIEEIKRENAELQEAVAALSAVATTLRMGRRPNKAQWQAAGMLPHHAQLESDRVD